MSEITVKGFINKNNDKVVISPVKHEHTCSEISDFDSCVGRIVNEAIESNLNDIPEGLGERLSALETGKSDINHTHNGYAPVSHTHSLSQIVDYNTHYLELINRIIALENSVFDSNLYDGGDLTHTVLSPGHPPASDKILDNLPAGTYNFIATISGFPEGTLEACGLPCLVFMAHGSTTAPSIYIDLYLINGDPNSENVVAIEEFNKGNIETSVATDVYVVYGSKTYVEYLQSNLPNVNEILYPGTYNLSISNISVNSVATNS